MKNVLVVIIVILILGTFGSCLSGGTTAERDVNECSACGRRFYAADEGGNYMSIAYSGLCKSCNHDYKLYKEVEDYFDLND